MTLRMIAPIYILAFRSHEASKDYKTLMGILFSLPPSVSKWPATGRLSSCYLKTSKLVVVVYDAVLSFQQEIKCIWGRKARVATILYLFVRYGMIINMGFRIFDTFYVFKTVSVSNIVSRGWK